MEHVKNHFSPMISPGDFQGPTVVLDQINGNFRILKWRYLIYKAYIRPM